MSPEEKRKRRNEYAKQYRLKNLEKVRKYRREYAKKWRAANPEKVLELNRKYHQLHVADGRYTPRRRAYSQWRYGLTELEFKNLLKSQNNCCAICNYPIAYDPAETEKQLTIDHCHSTGKVRGLLCRHCNSGLGQFGDSTETLAKAIQYLNKLK